MEFTLVSALLAMLFAALLQFGVAIHIRNTLLDAAAEGARWAALADNAPSAGVRRTQELIASALGEGYDAAVSARYVGDLAQVQVRAALPLIGTFGPPVGLEVVSHAAREKL